MSVTRVNQFRARPGAESEMLAQLRAIVAALRQTAGCEACSLLQDVDDAASFAVVEVWQTREAHQAAVQGIDAGDLAGFMALLAGPPSGAFLEELPTAGDENA